jgi:SP family myo-inositol transporter-like MFS transporter 13
MASNGVQEASRYNIPDGAPPSQNGGIASAGHSTTNSVSSIHKINNNNNNGNSNTSTAVGSSTGVDDRFTKDLSNSNSNKSNDGAISEEDSSPSKFLYLLITCLAIGGFLFGYDTGVIAGALLPIKEEFGLSSQQQEFVVGGELSWERGVCIFFSHRDKSRTHKQTNKQKQTNKNKHTT